MSDAKHLKEINGARLMTLRQVASYFHVHPATVYALGKGGHLRTFRVGRDFRFGIKVLEDFITKGGTSSSDFDEQK
jgi:excisionase family DNA binding protein